MAFGRLSLERIRIGVANTLSCFSCAFMMLLVVMLIYKAATNQLLVPNAIYFGLAISLAILLLAEVIAGSVPGRAFLVVAAARALFALLLKPFLFVLASAFDDGNWILAIALVVIAIIAAQPTIRFFQKRGEDSIDLDRSAI
jgi:hypothetical protein